MTEECRLNLDKDILELSGKVYKKVSAFSRLRNYLNSKQASILCNAKVLTTFNYCTLVWMFSSKAVNNKIDRTQKGVFWVNKDNNLSFDMYLKREAGTKIHIKNLQKLRLEVFRL